RHTSFAVAPASTSFSARMICSSVNLLLRPIRPPLEDSPFSWSSFRGARQGHQHGLRREGGIQALPDNHRFWRSAAFGGRRDADRSNPVTLARGRARLRGRWLESGACVLSASRSLPAEPCRPRFS